MSKQRKSNTFENLFGDLLKTLQLIDGKDLTPFQSQLYENTLHSAIQARKRKEYPDKQIGIYGCGSYQTMDTTPNAKNYPVQEDLDVIDRQAQIEPEEGECLGLTDKVEEAPAQEYPPI